MKKYLFSIFLFFSFMSISYLAYAESGQGLKLLKQNGCMGCHSIQGKGGSIGPKLDGVGSRRNKAWLAGHISDSEAHHKKDPASHTLPAEMPKYDDLSPLELAAIVNFLSDQK